MTAFYVFGIGKTAAVVSTSASDVIDKPRNCGVGDSAGWPARYATARLLPQSLEQRVGELAR